MRSTKIDFTKNKTPGFFFASGQVFHRNVCFFGAFPNHACCCLPICPHTLVEGTRPIVGQHPGDIQVDPRRFNMDNKETVRFGWMIGCTIQCLEDGAMFKMNH